MSVDIWDQRLECSRFLWSESQNRPKITRSATLTCERVSPSTKPKVSVMRRPVTRGKSEKGMTIVVIAVVTIALVGTLGLAIDMGRVFIAKNETQTFADAGALAASLQLDGTSDGITRAKAAVLDTGNTWNLSTTAFPTPVMEFAKLASGPWVADPTPPTGYGFIRVTASVALPVYFSPIITQKMTQTVTSIGVSGQIPEATLSQGLGPYTAVASDLSSPTLGLVVGDQSSAPLRNVASSLSTWIEGLKEFVHDLRHSATLFLKRAEAYPN